MTPTEWAELNRLLGRIQAVMICVLFFVALSLLGAMLQRGADVEAVKRGMHEHAKVLERIEVGVRRLEARVK
jgi:hypothetical protein